MEHQRRSRLVNYWECRDGATLNKFTDQYAPIIFPLEGLAYPKHQSFRRRQLVPQAPGELPAIRS